MNTQQQETESEDTGMRWKHAFQIIVAVILIGLATTVLILAMPTLRSLGSLFGYEIAFLLVAGPFGLAWWVYRRSDDKTFQARLVKPNAHNAYGKLFEKRRGGTVVVEAANGELPNVVPHSYSPAIHNHNDVNAFAKMLEMGRTQVQVQEIEERSEVIAKSIHIPTFREMLDAGEIGPGQKELLLCHELVHDEGTGKLTGELQPWHGSFESTSTNFLGGSSKSGKTTYMTHGAAQGALMNALYCVFDPHLMHPEKSLAKKLEPLARSFILPPAMTDQQVQTTLNFLKGEAYARENGIETRYSGRLIIVEIDEALAFMSRAQRTDDKEIQNLYRDLALFMRDLGTQYNKFGINGVFASQYISKEAFKLPGGNIDFRDGCQSQTLLKLPPNQAQLMRLLDKKDLPGIRSLPPGHGYMGFAEGGEVIRMASGNVTRQDIEYVAQLTQPSPDRTKQYSMPDIPMRGERGERGGMYGEGDIEPDEEDSAAFPQQETDPHAQTYHSPVNTGELSDNPFTPHGKPFPTSGESTGNGSPISQEERLQIITIARAQLKKDKKVTRSEIPGLLGQNNRYYSVVKQVLDEEGL